MNHQAVSEIFFVESIEPAGLCRSDLTRALQTLCRDQLRAQLDGSILVRDIGVEAHRIEPTAGAATATVTAWVERLGESDVTFRVVTVTVADSEEIADLSVSFEVVASSREITVATTHGPRAMACFGSDGTQAREAVRDRRAAALQ